MEELKCCPHCGDLPEVQTLGSCIEIICCSEMNIQKSDHLTSEESDTWDSDSLTHSDEAEAKTLNVIVSMWNQRTKQGDKSSLANCISCDDRKVENDKLVCSECFYSYAPDSKEQLKIRRACEAIKEKKISS